MNLFHHLLNNLKMKIRSYLSSSQSIYIMSRKGYSSSHPYIAVDFHSRRITPYWCRTPEKALHDIGPALKDVNYDHLRKHNHIVEIYTITEYPELFI